MQRRARVEHGLGGGEGLRGDRDQGRGGIEAGDRLLERGAVDIGDDRRLVAAGVAAERVDQQMRPERRAADADMEDVADRAERLRLDRVDQRAHPGVQAGGAGDAFRRALPALGAVLGGAALGRVDDLAGEHRVAAPRRGRPASASARKASIRPRLEMGLGEIEADAASSTTQPREPVGLGREQLAQACAVGALSQRLVQASFAHVAASLGAATG